jgi:hypothetical protein
MQHESVTLAGEAAPRADIGLGRVLREFFSHFDNALYSLLLLVVLAITLADGPRASDLVWFALGWLVFLPQEWLTHVYVLHWICPKRPLLYRWMYRLHYGHHDLPNRHDLMYMPMWLTLPMTVANYAAFCWLLPDLHAAHMAFAGALAGYLLFEGSHLLCHVPMPVRGVWQRVRARHLAHHFVDEQRCYSVSPPAQWIDRLTGRRTVGEAEPGSLQGPRSPLCRTLVPGLDLRWRDEARQHFAPRSSGDLHRSRTWLVGRRRRD